MITLDNHWILHDTLDTDAHGFLYLIIDKNTGHFYIGRKVFKHKVRRPPLKGKKRPRIDYKDSGWGFYTGSCTALNDEIEKRRDTFEFHLIKVFETKQLLNYAESCMIMKCDGLTRGDCYNGNISGVRSIPNSIETTNMMAQCYYTIQSIL